jgi:hypothetical protein
MQSPQNQRKKKSPGGKEGGNLTGVPGEQK